MSVGAFCYLCDEISPVVVDRNGGGLVVDSVTESPASAEETLHLAVLARSKHSLDSLHRRIRVGNAVSPNYDRRKKK